jgi:hypothetical protein
MVEMPTSNRSRPRRLRGTLNGAAILAIAMIAVVGCDTQPKLVPPSTLSSPWPTSQTWAVVPFANESGVSIVDTFAIADSFQAEIDGVEGISCLPVNRTVAGMRAANLRSLQSEADVQLLMETLGVDGLVVGTVTAYDPYRPLQLGIAAQVYTGTRPPEPTSPNLESMTMATTDAPPATETAESGPSSQYSRVYDASNHDVLALLASYASGRVDPKSGAGAAVYTLTMSSYQRFVAYDVTRQLLMNEVRKSVARPETTAVHGE